METSHVFFIKNDKIIKVAEVTISCSYRLLRQLSQHALRLSVRLHKANERSEQKNLLSDVGLV